MISDDLREISDVFVKLSQEKNTVEEIESIMNTCAEQSSSSWVCILEKSLAIAHDFWNTNSWGWTPFRTGAHDGFSMSLSYVPSSLLYKTHLSRQYNWWSLRWSWSIACRRCSNYIFILNLTAGFNGLIKDNCKMRWETFMFVDWVRLILEIWRWPCCKSMFICRAMRERTSKSSVSGSVWICCGAPTLNMRNLWIALTRLDRHIWQTDWGRQRDD